LGFYAKEGEVVLAEEVSQVLGGGVDTVAQKARVVIDDAVEEFDGVGGGTNFVDIGEAECHAGLYAVPRFAEGTQLGTEVAARLKNLGH
jgi:hypothetical protein